MWPIGEGSCDQTWNSKVENASIGALNSPEYALSQIYHHWKRNYKLSENLRKAVLIGNGFRCGVKRNCKDMTGNGKPCWFNIIWLAVPSMLKLKTPIMHRVYFSTWVASVLLSMNWSEIIPRGMIKRIFKLIQNRKLTRNMISCIFSVEL